jgi:WD40 repeat protein
MEMNIIFHLFQYYITTNIASMSSASTSESRGGSSGASDGACRDGENIHNVLLSESQTVIASIHKPSLHSPIGEWPLVVTSASRGDEICKFILWDSGNNSEIWSRVCSWNCVYAFNFARRLLFWCEQQDQTAKAECWNADLGNVHCVPTGKYLKRISDAQFNSQGTRFLTAGWRKFVAVWDADSGKVQSARLCGVVAASFTKNPDQTLLVIFSEPNVVYVLDPETASEMSSFPLLESLKSLRWPPDKVVTGTYVPVCGALIDKSLTVWDYSSGARLFLDESCMTDDFAFGFDDKTVVAITSDYDMNSRCCTLVVWDIDSAVKLFERDFVPLRLVGIRFGCRSLFVMEGSGLEGFSICELTGDTGDEITRSEKITNWLKWFVPSEGTMILM